MKKLLGILLVIVFAFSIYYSISNDFVLKSHDSSIYAAGNIPIPPPKSPEKLGL